MNRRRIAAVATSVVIVLLLGNIVYGLFDDDGTIAPEKVLRRIDLVASVESFDVDPDWSMSAPRTTGGQARLALDDLRSVVIHEGTLVDDHTAVPACADLTTANACVLLADMLGDAVVWFALVPADSRSGREFLTLPGLIDMRSNGDEGVLRNGWVLALTTGVRRQCEGVDTRSLRDFINRFPDTSSVSVVSLTNDEIVSVRCLDG